MTTAPRMVGPLRGGPVFVDASGRRRRTMSVLGYLGAAACAIYLAAFGATMTTSAGAVGELAGAALTPTPLPDEDDGGPDGPDDAAVPAIATPALATPAVSTTARPVVATSVRTTAVRTRAGSRLVELHHRTPAATIPAARHARPTTAPRVATPRHRAAVAPAVAGRTAARPAPVSTPAVRSTAGGTTATPRSGTTGSGTTGSGTTGNGSGSGTTGNGSGSGTTGSGTSTGAGSSTGNGGTTGTGTTGNGGTGTGTTGAGTTGTSSTTTGTGVGPLMGAETADVLTIGPIASA